MNSGQSKQVFVGVAAMQQIVSMADDPDKFPYAIIIGVLAFGYIIKQTIMEIINAKKDS